MTAPPPIPFARALAADPYYLSLIPAMVLPGRFLDGLPPELQARYRDAVAHIGTGDWTTAQAELTALTVSGQGRDRGLFPATEAMARCAQGDEAGAAAALDLSLAAAPECAEYHHMAGSLAIRRREPATAALRFQEAARLHPDFGLAWAGLALLHGLDDNWSATEEPARRALARGCELGPGLIALCLMFACLEQGKPVPGPFLMPPPTTTATTADRVLSRLPAVDADSLCWPIGDDPVVLVVCDPVYFAEHALPLVWSLEAVSTTDGPAVHLHIINPNPGDDSRLKALVASLARVRLGYSFETADLERFGPAPVYFSSARFCRLYQFVRATNRPMLMVDADGLFRQPPRRIPGWAETSLDIALAARPEAPPWEAFLAGAIYAAPTPDALNFLGAAAVFIGQNLIARKGRWFLDQIALTLAYRNRPPSLRLKTWTPDDMIDLNHQEHSIYWAVTLRKGGDGPYQVYRRALRHRYDTEIGRPPSLIAK